MDITIIISDTLDNQNIESNLFSDFLVMSEEYRNYLLMEEFREEFNIPSIYIVN